MITATDLQISGNYKGSEMAFYAAEAGIEEARGRLRANAGAGHITDSMPTSVQWRGYIGALTLAQANGFDPNLSTSLRTDSLQSNQQYLVVLKHRTNAAGQILYWGDDLGSGVNRRNTTTGSNIYVATTTGYTPTANRTVEAEVASVPPIAIPAAVYVRANTTIQGSSTYIIGNDGCGSQNVSGLATTLAPGTVNLNGNPNILGTGGTPSIAYNQADLNMAAMVNMLKRYANYTYTVSSATNTGMNWGTPTMGATQQQPSACSVHNVVYYNTSGTYIRLTGDSSGCGILLVDGDLDLHGGFSWYGPILTTGSITFTGGGDKQVTGNILAGSSANADLVGGNASVVFCSTAIADQTQNLPLLTLSWLEP